ncbi:phage gp6-like head-tail connector protein [Enterococcus sp. AZ007]|uniref:phage gp6-like head-tail connector protein n=1 Tax=Enterococcus sp. AZ007 TaxID=2774839 RepID=UPI003F1E89D1
MEIDLDVLLNSYKDRFRITHSSEDESIKELLNDSYKDIADKIGDFEPDKFSQGKDLVIERTRYVKNESLEFFYDNFQQMIFDASLSLMTGGDDDGN